MKNFMKLHSYNGSNHYQVARLLMGTINVPAQSCPICSPRSEWRIDEERSGQHLQQLILQLQTGDWLRSRERKRNWESCYGQFVRPQREPIWLLSSLANDDFHHSRGRTNILQPQHSYTGLLCTDKSTNFYQTITLTVLCFSAYWIYHKKNMHSG